MLYCDITQMFVAAIRVERNIEINETVILGSARTLRWCALDNTCCNDLISITLTAIYNELHTVCQTR